MTSQYIDILYMYITWTASLLDFVNDSRLV